MRARRVDALRRVACVRGRARRERGKRAVASADASTPPRVLVLTGPTAVGKSACAVAIAERFASCVDGRASGVSSLTSSSRAVEIVSCDSVQIYRGLDVGSGKVSARARARATHHLLDERDARSAGDAYDASAYYDDAVRVLREIHARGNVALVVGGAGMYLKWLTDGKPTAPASDADSRAAAERAIEDARARGGWRAACEALTRLGDAETPRTLSENDWYRLTRAYEIFLASGRAVSTFERAAPDARFDFRCFFLSAPRVELYRKIDVRVEEMMVRGIMDEAAWLLDAGVAPGSSIPSRAIGYRQAMEYLVRARSKEIDVNSGTLLELLREIQSLNRAYAKRQFTWFRGESRYAWIDASASSEDVARRVLTEFERDEHPAGGAEISDVSKDELNELKRYKPRLSYLDDARALQSVVDRVRALASS